MSVFTGQMRLEADDHDIFEVKQRRPKSRLLAVLRKLKLKRPAIFAYGNDIVAAVLARHAVDALDVFEMEESFGWCADVCRRLPIPTVVKLHGPAFLSLLDMDSRNPELRRRIQLEGNALVVASTIVAPSESTMSATAARYSLSPDVLVSIANPVRSVTDQLGWRFREENSDTIIYVGRFDYRKGGDSVVLAFAKVCELRPSARLTFIGPDSGVPTASGRLQHFVDYVQTHCSEQVATRISFLGCRSPAEIGELRLEAGVIVVASRWESFGYVVAEAMSQGCPIVGFDVDGVNELIDNERSGLLVPLDDINALAGGICRVLESRALAERLGHEARASVVASCGAEKVANQMLAVYDEARGRFDKRSAFRRSAA